MSESPKPRKEVRVQMGPDNRPKRVEYVPAAAQDRGEGVTPGVSTAYYQNTGMDDERLRASGLLRRGRKRNKGPEGHTDRTDHPDGSDATTLGSDRSISAEGQKDDNDIFYDLDEAGRMVFYDTSGAEIAASEDQRAAYSAEIPRQRGGAAPSPGMPRIQFGKPDGTLKTLLARGEENFARMTEEELITGIEKLFPPTTPVEGESERTEGVPAERREKRRSYGDMHRIYARERRGGEKTGPAFLAAVEGQSINSARTFMGQLIKDGETRGYLEGALRTLEQEKRGADNGSEKKTRLDQEIDEDIERVRRGAPSESRDTGRRSESEQERFNREIEEDLADARRMWDAQK